MGRVRQIVRVNQDLCDGCGQCVTPCAEAALEVVDGKARVVREELCDGAGFCLAVCPTGALSVVEREAPDFDEESAARRRAGRLEGRTDNATIRCFNCGAGENDRPLLPVRQAGRSEWVCSKCLPNLIHGSLSGPGFVVE